jgi:hypothetical protein
MSKLIVEMEMPIDCWCCPNGHPDWIYNDDGAAQMVCFCNICNTEEDDKWISETETERPSWCPIKGVLPDEHGDLIDRDELLKECYPDDEFDSYVIYADDIHKAKAVIAAERKDNGTDQKE